MIAPVTGLLILAALAPNRPPALWTLDLQAGPYRPTISNNADNAEFFRLMFKRGLNDAIIDGEPLLKTLTMDYYILHPFGGLGLTGGVGHWGVTGRARLCRDESGTAIGCSTEQGSDPTASSEGNTKTSFTIVPVSLGVVYRVDALWKLLKVPLLPYVKAGADYHFWWAHTADKISTAVRDGKTAQGKGGTWGANAKAGLAINLDWLDPRTSTSGLLVGTHLFGEAAFLFADGFGQKTRLNMSDTVFSIGFALDFSRT